MTQASFHTRQQFERAVERMIERADAQQRGEDLDRVVQRLQTVPDAVSQLAGLLMQVDDDARPELKQHIDAYRRFLRQKGDAATDDEVLEVLLAVWRRRRA